VATCILFFPYANKQLAYVNDGFVFTHEIKRSVRDLYLHDAYSSFICNDLFQSKVLNSVHVCSSDTWSRIGGNISQ
jgi:hypothetical protein